jgi:hypothetical protein
VFGLIRFGVSGCAVTDLDPSADFTQYKTFAWGKSEVDVKNPIYESDLINERIRSAVEAEFARRGIVKARNNPDFIVTYHTYTEKKKSATGPYSYRYGFYPYAYYPYAFGYGYPYWMIRPNVREYTEGTLILDIHDNRSNELVWRGSVSGNVDYVASLKKQIEKGIKAIMKKYPVTPDEPLNLCRDSDVVS